MSYRNKGTIPPSVTVSRYPDVSGNYVCDGTNDNVEIQAAIDYVNTFGGGLVYLKRGNYSIGATIVLYPMCSLMGEGIKRTYLTLANGVNDDVIEYGATANTATFIYLGHFMIVGNKAQQAAGHGIYMYNNGGIVMDILIDWVWVSACKVDGIHLENTWGVRIVNSLVEGCDGAGFWLQNSTEGYINNLYSASNGGDGFKIQGGSRLRAVNLRADGNQYAYNIYQHDDGHFANLLAYNSTDTVNFWLRGNTDTIFTNCESDGNSAVQYGWRIEGVGGVHNQKISLIGCIAKNHNVANGRGIRIYADQEDITIVGGHFYNNIGTADITNAGTRVWIEDNTLSTVVDTGVDTRIPELWVQVSDPDSNVGDHPALVLPDTVDTPFRFQVPIPMDFQQLQAAQVIVTQLVTAGPPNMQWSTTTDWGKLCAGENYDAGNDAETDQTTAVTINQLNCIDVSGSLTGIAAGDLVGFTFIRRASQGGDTINADAYYLGFRLRYV